MDWYKRFKSKACILKLKAETKAAALDEVVAKLESAGLLTAEQREGAQKALEAREQLASTGVGMNVAIPHVRLAGLEEAACSLAVSREGIDWQAVDGAPVHILFTVLRPEDETPTHDPDEHLEMMRWIAKLARDADFRAFALQARTKAELLGLLKEMSVV